MGKNLKGKEIGKGICQRKDGLYTARFVGKSGKKYEKYFKTIPEARNWLEDARYADKHDETELSSEVTVDEWFEYWIENIVGDLAPNTRRNYRERYVHNIQPCIGKMLLTDVKPMHCKKVLNRMEKVYAGGTIRQAYITMGAMLRSALMNDMISKHPMNGVLYTKPVRAVEDIHFLTVEEQRTFLAHAERSHNYRQYALILETGLRTGELIGLTWDAIDFEKRTLTVNKTLEYRHKDKIWRAGPPKTKQSYRTIPLTSRAVELLKELYAERVCTSNLIRCLLNWSTWIVGRDRCQSCGCVIWFSSTGGRESLRRTARMIPTYTSCAMKRASSAFACMRCATPTRRGQSKAECSRRCCRGFWDTRASRPPWTATSM